jgi:hypothetical protein
MCFFDTWKEISSMEKCNQDYCPNECDSFSYNMKTTSHAFPVLNDFMAKQFFSLTVYYDDLSYTLIEQLPKLQTYDLISKIGGTWGIFLGLSCVTLIEFIEFIIEIMFIYIFS